MEDIKELAVRLRNAVDRFCETLTDFQEEAGVLSGEVENLYQAVHGKSTPAPMHAIWDSSSPTWFNSEEDRQVVLELLNKHANRLINIHGFVSVDRLCDLLCVTYVSDSGDTRPGWRRADEPLYFFSAVTMTGGSEVALTFYPNVEDVWEV